MHPSTNTYAAARFDKNKHTWTIYRDTEGFPQKDASDYRLIPDTSDPAHACWLITRRRLYRLDISGHWNDRTEEVTGGDPTIAVTNLFFTPSGDAWAMIGAAIQDVSPAQRRSSGAKTPLVAYWDRKTDSFVRHRPNSMEPGLLVYSTDLLLEPGGNVILGTTRGAYRLDKHSEKWSRLEIPTLPDMPVNRVVQDKNGLWLLGESIIAYLHP